MGKNEDIAADLLRRLDNPEPDPTIKTEVSEYVKVSVADLRAACLANHHHPLAETLLRSCADHGEDFVLAVDRQDLLGLLHNRAVEVEPIGPGRFRKRLGDEYPKGKAVKTFPPSVKPPGRPDEEPDLGSTSPADADEDQAEAQTGAAEEYTGGS